MGQGWFISNQTLFSVLPLLFNPNNPYLPTTTPSPLHPHIPTPQANGYEDAFLSYTPMEHPGEALILSDTYVYWRRWVIICSLYSLNGCTVYDYSHYIMHIMIEVNESVITDQPT